MTTITGIAPVRMAAAGSAARAPILMYDASAESLEPLSKAKIAADPIAKQAAENAQKVMTFLADRFDRNGFDGKGSPLEVVVHMPDPESLQEKDGRVMPRPMNNAFWAPEYNALFLGDGDGRNMSALGGGLDVLAHEIGHGILNSDRNVGFEGEQGALHESFGDVLASMIDGNWTIGEDILTPSIPGDSMRDMSKPSNFRHMSQVKSSKDTEVHDLADIPNLAAVRAAELIGRTEMGDVWFRGFTEQLRDAPSFSDAAAATIKAASLLFGDSSKQVAGVTQAWESVGVLAPARSGAGAGSIAASDARIAATRLGGSSSGT